MHFAISRKDAENIIRERFNLHSDIPVIISRPRPKPVDPLFQKLKGFNIVPEKKIQNIKTLRDIYLEERKKDSDSPCYLDLRTAKEFVENWEKFLKAYKKNGKLPAMIHPNGDIE